VSTLGTKMRRDLRHRAWQYAAVGITVFLGVLMFAASYDAYRNLTLSYDTTYDRLAFADLVVSGGDGGLATAVAAVEGVDAVESRRQLDPPMSVDGDRFIGRLVGQPTDRQPAVDRIDVIEGTDLGGADPDQVVIETHMAEAFGIGPGDIVEVFDGTTWRQLEVIGVAISPEYLWPARDRQDLFPLAKTFGVAFIDEAVLDQLPATTVTDQVLVTYADDAPDDVEERVRAVADGHGAGSYTTRDDHPSASTLQLDVDGFQEMALAFPVLFLTAAGMAVYVILSRTVTAERSIIGTLRASGMSATDIRRHYLGFGLILGVGGAALGVLVGVAAGTGLSEVYTSALDIPDTATALYPITPVIGLAFGLVAGLVSAWMPSRAAARIPPAEAMRGPTTGRPARGSRLGRLPLLRGLPVRWTMALRGIGRSRGRSISTVLGVVLALVLVLASWGMIDTVDILLDRQFSDIDRVDGLVVFDAPLDQATLDDVGAVDGVERAEPTATLGVTAKGPSGSYETSLTAFEADTRLHGWTNPSGGLPETGILAGVALGDEIGVDAGDRIEISIPSLATSVEAEVVEFVDEPLGTVLYVSIEELERLLAGADPAVDGSVLAEPGVGNAAVLVTGDRQDVLADLGTVDGVAAVVDERVLADTVDQYMGLFYAFVGIMLLFGGIMAFALMFNTMAVNLAERRGEFATLKASGMPTSTIAWLVTGENLLLTAVGIIPGLLIGWLVAAVFMQQFTSDTFNFDLQMHPTTFVWSAVAMLVVALLSLWPGIRWIRRLNVGLVVRERST
jgi:putative ABC transport system permease protein